MYRYRTSDGKACAFARINRLHDAYRRRAQILVSSQRIATTTYRTLRYSQATTSSSMESVRSKTSCGRNFPLTSDALSKKSSDIKLLLFIKQAPNAKLKPVGNCIGINGPRCQNDTKFLIRVSAKPLRRSSQLKMPTTRGCTYRLKGNLEFFRTQHSPHKGHTS